MDHGRRAAAAKTLCKIGPGMKQGTSEAEIKTTHTLETPEADIVYDVLGPLPTADGRPVLFMIGQPMDASGFQTLASHFPDRTVVTYDPRGLGRSNRKDGRVENAANLQARDLHALIEALGAGPVEMFASSGGAVTWRTSLAAAELLGQRARVFPSHHGGFVGPEMGGYAGKPEEFARRLREVLDDNKGQ